MKLEYINDLTDGGKYPRAFPVSLVRLFEFTEKERADLLTEVRETIFVKSMPLKLHELPFINPLNCKVTLVLGIENIGLTMLTSKNEFLCQLNETGYENLLQVIDHLNDGYNWLTLGEVYDETPFLLSKVGEW